LSGSAFRRTRTITEDDVDGLGHVNNAVWVEFIIALSDAHSTDRGFDQKAVRELGGIWIVRRHEIDYHASAVPGEEVVEQTWVSSMKGARSIRHCQFTRARDGKTLLTSTTTWAFVEPETQRPRRIPRPILDSFERARGTATLRGSER
jgi:acyl-CoA thioester hydrolase